MSAIKKFFEKKKADMRFQTAGPGHKLNESQSKSKAGGSSRPISEPSRHQPSVDAQRAGAAALARIEQKQSGSVNWSIQATKEQARKEIELENASKSKQFSSAKKDMVVPDVCPSLTVSGVYFKCPIIGPDILPKNEIREKIKQFLYGQLVEERGLTACLIIHTLNHNPEKVQVGVETLARYFANLIDHPGEEKYRRIRINNKVFRERVLGLEGASDLLQAAGFARAVLDHEEFFVFEAEPCAEEIETLQMLKEALLSAEPVLPVLDRNLRVLRPAQAAQKISLPDDFFSLSADELRKEQEAKSEIVEQMTQLRTKAMRERDEIRELHVYKFSLVRIRFPDGIILQGTFYVHERLSAVKEFVIEHLCDPSSELQLHLAGETRLNEDSTLLELRLVPAALLTAWWPEGNCPDTFLKPEVMAFLSDL